jgi:hypothetical protein
VQPGDVLVGMQLPPSGPEQEGGEGSGEEVLLTGTYAEKMARVSTVARSMTRRWELIFARLPPLSGRMRVRHDRHAFLGRADGCGVHA